MSETVSAKRRITQIIHSVISRQLGWQQEMPDTHTSWDCVEAQWGNDAWQKEYVIDWPHQRLGCRSPSRRWTCVRRLYVWLVEMDSSKYSHSSNTVRFHILMHILTQPWFTAHNRLCYRAGLSQSVALFQLCIRVNLPSPPSSYPASLLPFLRLRAHSNRDITVHEQTNDAHQDATWKHVVSY